MYELDDVMLSVRKYVALALDTTSWRLRLEREPIADDARPVLVIEAGQKTTPTRRAALDQGPVMEMVPLTLTAYPETDGTVRAAGRRARRLSSLLERIATYGIDMGAFPVPDPRAGRPIAGPMRFPVWDFADTEVEGDPDERESPALPYDVLWVEDSSVSAVQDPDDERRWTVVMELRVSWTSPGRTPQETLDAPLATDGPVGVWGGEVFPDA